MKLRLANISETVLNPALALLPPKMDSKGARVQLLATGLQESGFEHRDQIDPLNRPGPAMGFWQFEKGGGAAGVLRHPESRALMREICRKRGCAATAAALWESVARDDILACAAARLLYWTDPKPLPSLNDPGGAWDYYIRNWRPGKPHPATWPAFHALAVAEVMGD